MTEKATNQASDVFDQGLKNYEQAVRTALRFQEEAGRNWLRMFNCAGSPQDFQRHAAAIDNEFISATRKTMEGCADLFEQNLRAGADLAKRGLEAAQADTPAERHAKTADYYEGALKAFKANGQAMVDISYQTMGSWLLFSKKVHAPAAETKSPKA